MWKYQFWPRSGSSGHYLKAPDQRDSGSVGEVNCIHREHSKTDRTLQNRSVRGEIRDPDCFGVGTLCWSVRICRGWDIPESSARKILTFRTTPEISSLGTEHRSLNLYCKNLFWALTRFRPPKFFRPWSGRSGYLKDSETLVLVF